MSGMGSTLQLNFRLAGGRWSRTGPALPAALAGRTSRCSRWPGPATRSPPSWSRAAGTLRTRSGPGPTGTVPRGRCQLSVWSLSSGGSGWSRFQVINVTIPYGSSG